MPPVDRNHPKRAKSSDARVSLIEFMREFPDDAACLEWLWRERFSPDGEHAHCPKCDRERRVQEVRREGAPLLDLYRLRPPRLRDRRDDLSQVVHVAPALVPRDVLDGEHPLRHFREATGARDW